jgi:hypothetical protein
MKIQTIVLTYRRPRNLTRCLEAQNVKLCPAGELSIAGRDTNV